MYVRPAQTCKCALVPITRFFLRFEVDQSRLASCTIVHSVVIGCGTRTKHADARCCFVVCQCANGHVVPCSMFNGVLQGEIEAMLKIAVLMLSETQSIHEACAGGNTDRNFWSLHFGSIPCRCSSCRWLGPNMAKLNLPRKGRASMRTARRMPHLQKHP